MEHKKTPEEMYKSMRELSILVGIVLFIVIVVAVVLGIGWASTVADLEESNKHITANTHRIRHLVKKLSGQEKEDVTKVRKAAARICARQNLERAEIHAAYQRPIVLLSPFDLLIKDEPVLDSILVGQESLRKVSLKRVHRLLPILDCEPNLRGRPATKRPSILQERFVNLYLAGKLDPIPGIAAVKNGPEERGKFLHKGNKDHN